MPRRRSRVRIPSSAPEVMLRRPFPAALSLSTAIRLLVFRDECRFAPLQHKSGKINAACGCRGTRPEKGVLLKQGVGRKWRNGRRSGLKNRWGATPVWVRVPLSAPQQRVETAAVGARRMRRRFSALSAGRTNDTPLPERWCFGPRRVLLVDTVPSGSGPRAQVSPVADATGAARCSHDTSRHVCR